MINLSNIKEFVNCWDTMKNTSIDKRDSQNPRYLTESDLQVLNFDTVKDNYIKPLGISEIPCSCDAVFQTNNRYFFIEFKAGNIKPSTKYAIRKKIYDTLLIFTDLVLVRISDLRTDAEYILVYDENVNRNNPDDDYQRKEKAVQESKSMNYIGKKIFGYAGQEIVCFGLKKFENYCFKKVHTYDLNEFEAFLSKYTSNEDGTKIDGGGGKTL